jgi:glycosyltransferase involved in cell wall biosynthesis
MLNYEFPPLGGGAGNANYFLLKKLAKQQDLEIDLITSSADKAYTEQFASNIIIHYLDIGKRGQNLQFQSQLDLIKYTARALIYACNLNKQQDYDVVHAWFGIPSGLIALLLRIFYKTPYIISLRGADVPGYKKRFKFLDKLVFGWLNKYFIWKQAKQVIANSQQLKQLALKTAPQQDIRVIPNGVDLETFKPKWNKSFDKIKITPGWTRLEKRKGLDLLLKAVASLDDKKLEVIIPGTGPELENLQNLAQKLKIRRQVRFLKIGQNTQENRQTVAQVLANCHILCLPSDNEGMSNAVLEGMACGLALLLTDVGGTRELLQAGENGFVVKRSVEDIAEKIKKLKQNQQLIKQQNQRLRRRAEKFSWEIVAEQYINYYRQTNV